MTIQCFVCGLLKSQGSFSKAQLKKSQRKCKTCIEKGLSVPTSNREVGAETSAPKIAAPDPMKPFSPKTFAFLKDSQKKGDLPFYRDAKGEDLQESKPCVCTFCGVSTSHNIKKFGVNYCCSLCEIRCEEMKIPKDLSQEEGDRLRAAALMEQVFGGATSVSDFTLGMRMRNQVQDYLAKQWQEGQGREEKEWHATH